jgi:hypothetical protein
VAFPAKLMVHNCVIVANHFFVKDLEGSRSFSWMLQDFHREPRLFTKSSLLLPVGNGVTKKLFRIQLEIDYIYSYEDGNGTLVLLTNSVSVRIISNNYKKL